MTQFNFSCDTDYPKATLLSLRKKLMRRLGFSAQQASPPPGMAELLTDFLTDAQTLIATGEHEALFRNRRWFTFPLVAGERFYGFPDNVEDPVCAKTLNPETIEWIGVSDSNDEEWYRLGRGIDPLWFNQTAESRPTHYEISQGIELWPPPDTTGDKLRVYGSFGLQAFTADADYTTIDPDCVFNYACAVAKAHYRQADAGNYMAMFDNRIAQLVANTHTNVRYIPRDMWRYCRDHNPGIFGSMGVRYMEDGSVRIVEEA
jgi:hypothetical protein